MRKRTSVTKTCPCGTVFQTRGGPRCLLCAECQAIAKKERQSEYAKLRRANEKRAAEEQLRRRGVRTFHVHQLQQLQPKPFGVAVTAILRGEATYVG